MEAERWRRLSPLLDVLLEQEAPVRAESLASLREEDPQLAADLEELLRLEEDSGAFLSEPVMPPMPGLRPDGVVGPYRLERMLGEGGMGQVWLARRDDGLYQKRVALKLLRPGLADPNLRLRFTRERQILARLEHPHIARLLDAGISGDGQPYLALEYVEGEPITDWCRAHEITLDARLHLFQQICRALSHAHANLIVHRDLKPSNILVTPLGEVRLLDFGIAKLLDTPESMPDRTRTGARAFTLHYAAPEQLRGEPVTTMTDVYALGMVLFELLTDARPYRLKRQSDAEWEDAILHADPQRASAVLQRSAEAEPDRDIAQTQRRRARMVAGDLDNIALKALAKRPEQRYASVEALAQDVQRYRDGKPVQARPQSLRYRIGKFIARHRWALGTAVLITAVLASALGIVAWQAQNALRQAARAQAMQGFVVGLIEHAGNASASGQLDLRALLDTGLARVDRELARQPATRAELYGVIAQLRTGLGDYRQAHALLQRQAALIATLPDPPPTLVLSSASELGRVRRLQGNPQGCIAVLGPRSEFARNHEQQAPVQAAEFYSQLGRCRRAVGERDAARLLFQRALELRRANAGTAAAAVETLADLAGLRAEAGQAGQALAEYQDALRELQARGGMRHPLAIELERTLCALERSEGRLDLAERHCRDALAMGKALQGDNHRATMDARRQLAALYVDQGRYAAAEAEFQRSRRWLVERLGAHHTDVARDDNSLAIIAWERGHARQALARLDHAVAILRGSPQPNNLAGVLFNKAMVLHETGAHRDALPLLDEARRLRVAQLGGTHALVGDTDRMIGEALAALGERGRAETALRSAAALTHAGYGPTHPHTRRAALSLARFRGGTGAAQNAEALRAIDTIARLPGTDAETAKLRWRARAYAAEARCRDSAFAAAAKSALQALRTELARAQPEGGELAREVAAIDGACVAPPAVPREVKAEAAPADRAADRSAPRRE
jgi:serine/threonine-protein kinase